MSVVSTTTIRQILDTHLNTVPSLPTFFEENQIPTSKNQPFVQSYLRPAPTTVATIGAVGWDYVQGIYQVNVYYPGGVGFATGTTMADTITSYFTRRQLTSGSTTITLLTSWSGTPSRIDGGSMFMIPVMVNWFMYNNPSQ